VILAMKGQSSTVIGKQLQLAPKTVHTCRGRPMAKMGVADVTAPK
jgi:DNA-binding NarL/FixJ family response regulator